MRDKALKNPLRLLDSKDPAVQALTSTAPSILDYLGPTARIASNPCNACSMPQVLRMWFPPRSCVGLTTTRRLCSKRKAQACAQATVFAGGRYDNLIKDVGGAATPSVGFGMGVERLLILLEEAKLVPTPQGPLGSS